MDEVKLLPCEGVIVQLLRQKLDLSDGLLDDLEESGNLQEVARAMLIEATRPTLVTGQLEGEGRFWLVLQEPSRIPDRKGPWLKTRLATVLREFIAARPTAYIHVLTVSDSGEPHIEHGPEVLQMLDGRSMSTGSKHNERTRIAHAHPQPGPSQ